MKLEINIKQVDFPQDQFIPERTAKTQVVLHHTVSGPGVGGDIGWWKKTADRIATCIIIERDGVAWQCFSSKYWAYHLGVKSKTYADFGLPYRKADRNSIGVELDSWGGLVKHTDGKYYPAKWETGKGFVANTKNSAIPEENIVIYPQKYRGFFAFEKYTDGQIESLRKLLIYWNSFYNIPIDYNEDIWDVTPRALIGDPGVYSHTSFRADKSDCHPQPELIEMLKNLCCGIN